MQVIQYKPSIKITNLESLPRGLKCPYLVTIQGQNCLVAKQWKRKVPVLQKNEILVAFTTQAFKEANKVTR